MGIYVSTTFGALPGNNAGRSASFERRTSCIVALLISQVVYVNYVLELDTMNECVVTCTLTEKKCLVRCSQHWLIP